MWERALVQRLVCDGETRKRTNFCSKRKNKTMDLKGCVLHACMHACIHVRHHCVIHHPVLLRASTIELSQLAIRDKILYFCLGGGVRIGERR
jgi:hypothetical protein